MGWKKQFEIKKTTKMKEKIKKGIIEMIPITLGILLALLLNNWQENRSDKKFIETVIERTTQEILENKRSLEEILPQHDAFSDTIYLYMENEDVSIRDLIRKVQSVNAPSIKNTSWKSFLNQNMKLIDYNLISYLSSVEEGKIGLDKKLDNMMKFVYENIESRERDKKETFLFIIEDFAVAEEAVLEVHNEYLKAVKASH